MTAWRYASLVTLVFSAVWARCMDLILEIHLLALKQMPSCSAYLQIGPATYPRSRYVMRRDMATVEIGLALSRRAGSKVSGACALTASVLVLWKLCGSWNC